MSRWFFVTGEGQESFSGGNNDERCNQSRELVETISDPMPSQHEDLMIGKPTNEPTRENVPNETATTNSSTVATLQEFPVSVPTQEGEDWDFELVLLMDGFRNIRPPERGVGVEEREEWDHRKEHARGRDPLRSRVREDELVEDGEEVRDIEEERGGSWGALEKVMENKFGKDLTAVVVGRGVTVVWDELEGAVGFGWFDPTEGWGEVTSYLKDLVERWRSCGRDGRGRGLLGPVGSQDVQGGRSRERDINDVSSEINLRLNERIESTRDVHVLRDPLCGIINLSSKETKLIHTPTDIPHGASGDLVQEILEFIESSGGVVTQLALTVSEVKQMKNTGKLRIKRLALDERCRRFLQLISPKDHQEPELADRGVHTGEREASHHLQDQLVQRRDGIRSVIVENTGLWQRAGEERGARWVFKKASDCLQGVLVEVKMTQAEEERRVELPQEDIRRLGKFSENLEDSSSREEHRLAGESNARIADCLGDHQHDGTDESSSRSGRLLKKQLTDFCEKGGDLLGERGGGHRLEAKDWLCSLDQLRQKWRDCSLCGLLLPLLHCSHWELQQTRAKIKIGIFSGRSFETKLKSWKKKISKLTNLLHIATSLFQGPVLLHRDEQVLEKSWW
jgi:hypothetical protein